MAENDLKMMPAWDTIEISEQGEDEQVIKSKIRVPQHLSLPGLYLLHFHVFSTSFLLILIFKFTPNLTENFRFIFIIYHCTVQKGSTRFGYKIHSN